MIVAEFSVIPLGEGSSVSRYVKAAVKELKGPGIKVEPSAMGTVIEANDLRTIFDAVERAHEAVFAAGIQRVVTELKIDERRDKELSIQSKLEALKNDG